VRRTLDEFRGRFAQHELAILEEVPPGALPAVGDDDRLGRAIAQLLDNAVKFTPAGGAIGVRVDRYRSGHYGLCVADTGPGIPPERQARVFDAFYQLDGSVTREHGGTGVGLAIARRTARGLGGELRLTSPATEQIAGQALRGAAFYLSVAQQAPNEVGAQADRG
jgi:signal transduction histidine kinase